MKTILLLILLFMPILQAQNYVDLSTNTMVYPAIYKEGDWCPVPVFTRTSDRVLTVTQGAAQSKVCFLHFSATNIVQWTKSVTITIADNGDIPSPYNDIIYFYWTTTTNPNVVDLHMSSHSNLISCDSGCKIDPPRVSDSFPAGALIAGMYAITSGKWNPSGHPIINQHQIHGGAPLVVNYTPNEGYTFTFDIKSPIVQQAQQAMDNIVPTINKSLTMIQTATETGVATVKKQVALAGAMPSDVNIATAQTQLADIQAKLSTTSTQATQAAQRAMAPPPQMYYQQNSMDIQMQIQNQMMARLSNILLRFRVDVPKDMSISCPDGAWSLDDNFVYLCKMPTWKKIPTIQ